MPTDARTVIESSVRLPPISEPRLNLQVFGGKNLDPDPVKKPRRVRRNVRRLVGPVIKIVIAEQANVGHKDARIDIETMLHVPVIATPPL